MYKLFFDLLISRHHHATASGVYSLPKGDGLLPSTGQRTHLGLRPLVSRQGPGQAFPHRRVRQQLQLFWARPAQPPVFRRPCQLSHGNLADVTHLGLFHKTWDFDFAVFLF